LERGLGGFFLCHIAKNGQLLPAQKGISAPPHGTRWRIVRPHPAAQLPGCAARCLQQRYIRVWEKSQQAFCSAKQSLYIQRHCLLQQRVLSVRIQPILALVKHEELSGRKSWNPNEPRDNFLLMKLSESQ